MVDVRSDISIEGVSMARGTPPHDCSGRLVELGLAQIRPVGKRRRCRDGALFIVLCVSVHGEDWWMISFLWLLRSDQSHAIY